MTLNIIFHHLQLIIGFSAPIKAEDYISLAFAANFQYQYVQFANITELSQYYFIKTVSREQREADIAARRDERLTFYTAVADMLRSWVLVEITFIKPKYLSYYCRKDLY